MTIRYTLGARRVASGLSPIFDGDVFTTAFSADATINISNDCEITGGLFYNGGDFLGGFFSGGTFCGGVFKGGRFCSGWFWGGEFHGGHYYGGEYYGGEFIDGEFHGGVYYDGSYTRGMFNGGVIHYGWGYGSPIMVHSPSASHIHEAYYNVG